MKTLRIIILSIASIFLIGCSIVPSANIPDDVSVFTIDTDHSQTQQTNHDSDLTLLISQISANPGYQTTEMIYVTKAYELNSFSKNRWLAPPADLLLPVISQKIIAQNYFSNVASSASYFKSDLLLNIHLVKLQQEFLNSPSEIVLIINAELISANDKSIVATKQFSSTKSTQQDTPYAGVIMTNQLANDLAEQIAIFVVSATEGMKKQMAKQEKTSNNN